MRELTFRQKNLLTVLEIISVFLTVFLNQMIITVFPAYESVKLNETLEKVMNSTTNPNCTMKDPSNSYVAIIIGSKYFTELIMFPIIGFIADHHHPPLILFGGLVTQTVACVVYSLTGNFCLTIFARIIDGFGNTLVSTSGLTIIYMIYLKDRPRNRLITLDSILAYISACLGPFIAGNIYESLLQKNDSIARLSTFMLVGPLFLICSILILPFAFKNSKFFAEWFYLSEKENETFTNEIIESLNNDSVDCKLTEDNSIKTSDTQTPLSLLILLKNKHIMLILMVLTSNSLVGNSLESTLPIFMIRRFCSDQREQGVVWLFGVMSFGGFFLSTFLFHTRPSICWILPFLGLLIKGALCMALPFCQNWWTIGLVLGFIYFNSSMAEVILIPMVPKIIDKSYLKSSYGSSSGLTLLTFTISGLIGTFPVGYLVDRFGFLTLCVILSGFNICLAPFIFCFKTVF